MGDVMTRVAIRIMPAMTVWVCIGILAALRPSAQAPAPAAQAPAGCGGSPASQRRPQTATPQSYALTLAVPLALCGFVVAQELDPETLLKPAADSWPTYHGNYSGRRHSGLTQITPRNVNLIGGGSALYAFALPEKLAGS